jgi:hypothetical protein
MAISDFVQLLARLNLNINFLNSSIQNTDDATKNTIAQSLSCRGIVDKKLPTEIPRIGITTKEL